MSEKEKKEPIILVLFWASSIWTITQSFFLIRFSIIGGNDIPAYFTHIWLAVISAYAGKLRASRWGTTIKNQMWGEYHVLLLWAVSLFLYFWNMLSANTILISDQLVTSCIGVTTIFFGSELFKAVDSSIQKRKSGEK